MRYIELLNDLYEREIKIKLLKNAFQVATKVDVYTLSCTLFHMKVNALQIPKMETMLPLVYMGQNLWTKTFASDKQPKIAHKIGVKKKTQLTF